MNFILNSFYLGEAVQKQLLLCKFVAEAFCFHSRRLQKNLRIINIYIATTITTSHPESQSSSANQTALRSFFGTMHEVLRNQRFRLGLLTGITYNGQVLTNEKLLKIIKYLNKYLLHNLNQFFLLQIFFYERHYILLQKIHTLVIILIIISKNPIQKTCLATG